MKDEMNEKGFNPYRLQRLAAFLAYGDVPSSVEFDMALYSQWGNYTDRNDCGTVGCAMGFTTFLWPKPSHLSYGQWEIKSFAQDEFSMWCFSPLWGDFDNTRLGAAKRIQFLLDCDGDLSCWDGDEETGVMLYANTEVRREHPLDIPKLSVLESPDSPVRETKSTDKTDAQKLVTALITKIEREPRYKAPEATK